MIRSLAVLVCLFLLLFAPSAFSDDEGSEVCIEVGGRVHCYHRSPIGGSAHTGEGESGQQDTGPPTSGASGGGSTASGTAETGSTASETADGEVGGGSTPQAVLATRTFVGPQEVPPDGFAAYGIVAFPNAATPSTRERYVAVCHAYWAALQEASKASAPKQEQMVTVWPVEGDELANEIVEIDDIVFGCEKAVGRYDLATGQLALTHANADRNDKLQGIGPYLLAWSPPSSKGKPGFPVLVADLSGATTERHFLEYFMKWKTHIQLRPELWDREGGWSVERVRRLFQEFADSSGRQIIDFVTGGPG